MHRIHAVPHYAARAQALPVKRRRLTNFDLDNKMKESALASDAMTLISNFSEKTGRLLSENAQIVGRIMALLREGNAR